LFIDTEAPIIMELPSYLGGIQAFRRSGADMIGIPLQSDGMDIQSLQSEIRTLAESGRKPRFIYTIPDFQNPSGITMSLDKRQELIRVSRQFEIPIIEDSPYRELSFSGEILPSLWSISGGEGVIMLKTFSKMLFPGMRMGWLVGDAQLMDKVIMLKQSIDLCTPPFNQLILAEYINMDCMKRTIKDAIQCYKPKLSAMLQALQDYMPKEVLHTLSHELFHVGYHWHHNSLPLQDANTNQKMIDHILWQLQNEGLATYTAYKLREDLPTQQLEDYLLLDNLLEVKRLFTDINDLLQQAKTLSPTEIREAVIDRGILKRGFYVVGAYMAQQIEKKLGKDMLVSSVSKGPLYFAKLYDSISDKELEINYSMPKGIK